MQARWLDHETIEAPAPAVDPVTGATGDGMGRIGEDDPRFAEWAAWLESTGQPRPAHE